MARWLAEFSCKAERVNAASFLEKKFARGETQTYLLFWGLLSKRAMLELREEPVGYNCCSGTLSSCRLGIPG